MAKRPPAFNPNPQPAPECVVSTRPPRMSPHARGYDAKWQKLRRMVLARQPVCVLCGEADKPGRPLEVDHIVALAKGGTNTMDNLRTLCKACHSRKTTKEDGAFGRGNHR